MYKCTYMIKIGKPLIFIRNIETYVAILCNGSRRHFRVTNVFFLN